MTNSHSEARPRVLNKKRDRLTPGAIYIGRPSKWGNLFQIGRDGDRSAVIAKHRDWLKSQRTLLASIGELRGRDLACFCARSPVMATHCSGSPIRNCAAFAPGRNRFARRLPALRIWPL